jgi:hypothetical protein
MNDHCTYITTHPIGLFYVGKGSVHKITSGKYKGSGVKLSRLWKSKFPKDEWTTKVLETFSTAEAAYNAEIILIAKSKLNPLCVNLADGGIGGKGFTGRKHSILAKKKMSAIALKSHESPECRAKMSAASKTKWENEELRAKMLNIMNSEIGKRNRSDGGKKRWTENPKIRTIDLISKDGKIVNTFINVAAMMKFLKCSKTMALLILENKMIIGENALKNGRSSMLDEPCYAVFRKDEE